MGNNTSTPQSSTLPPSTTAHKRPSHPNSPATKSSSTVQQSSTTLLQQQDDRNKFGRRRKSIELSEDSSMTFSSLSPSTSTTDTSTNRKQSISSSTSGTTPSRDDSGAGRPNHNRSSSSRRKGVRELTLTADEEFEFPGNEEGTLRGAMQGKAEHVVYGPRREENGITLPASAKTSLNLDDGGTVVVGSGGGNSGRPVSIALPSRSLTTLMDPDDTLHPGFTASPRLTSDVLLSSENMPVITSPAVTDTITTTESPFFKQQFKSPSSSLSQSQIPAATSSNPYPPTLAPSPTVLAPPIPSLPGNLTEDDIPSGTGVFSHGHQQPPSSQEASILLPPTLFNAPLAAIPLVAVPSATIAASIKAAAVDVGAGNEGVPTLIKWKDEDGQGVHENGVGFGPKEVFVTGTFAKGWKMKIELRRNSAGDFSALISLPPGPHRLKFIVDKEWKASKHLQLATDADGNLINYLVVSTQPPKSTGIPWTSTLINNRTEDSSSSLTPSLNIISSILTHSTTTTTSTPSSSTPTSTTTTPKPLLQPQLHKFPPPTSQWLMPSLDEDDPTSTSQTLLDTDDDSNWTQEIPPELVEWGHWEAEREVIETSPAFQLLTTAAQQAAAIPPPPKSSDVPPPMLPAQLEKGPLNHAAYVTQGSGDDNSILPKPDHSVINHLAASPIKGGFLSVGVTTRYKRKFVTIVYYKALSTPS